MNLHDTRTQDDEHLYQVILKFLHARSRYALEKIWTFIKYCDLDLAKIDPNDASNAQFHDGTHL